MTGDVPGRAPTLPVSPAHRRWLDGERHRLLGFGRRLGHPGGGSAYLGADGAPRLEEPVHTWITARMVHVYSLAALEGVIGAAELADAALSGLTGVLRDAEHRGWFTAVGPDGRAWGDGAKSCYDHAFVLLAASSATLAGRPGARALLDDARTVFLARFWDERDGMCVDAWDRTWSSLDPYRGINANMHAVEAMLATSDVDGGEEWVRRAARIASFLVSVAQRHDWRIPEHFDSSWTPDLAYNQDRPDDPFKPYGATVGHGLEWARLLAQLECSMPDHVPAPEGLVAAAEALFARAVADGWAVDGADGFVYTTDWVGRPVVAQRMHWVVAEAISAAAALWHRTGAPRYAELYAQWWSYAEAHLIDRSRGSWWHELDSHNQPAAGTWTGKPDLYHAVQATLIPQLPLVPGLARAVHDGQLVTTGPEQD